MDVLFLSALNYTLENTMQTKATLYLTLYTAYCWSCEVKYWDCGKDKTCHIISSLTQFQSSSDVSSISFYRPPSAKGLFQLSSTKFCNSLPPQLHLHCRSWYSDNILSKTFLFSLSYPTLTSDLLPASALFYCGPSNNSSCLGRAKNPNDGDDDDDLIRHALLDPININLVNVANRVKQ